MLKSTSLIEHGGGYFDWIRAERLGAGSLSFCPKGRSEGGDQTRDKDLVICHVGDHPHFSDRRTEFLSIGSSRTLNVSNPWGTSVNAPWNQELSRMLALKISLCLYFMLHVSYLPSQNLN